MKLSGRGAARAVICPNKELTDDIEELKGYVPPPLPPVLTGHVSSLLPY